MTFLVCALILSLAASQTAKKHLPQQMESGLRSVAWVIDVDALEAKTEWRLAASQLAIRNLSVTADVNTLLSQLPISGAPVSPAPPEEKNVAKTGQEAVSDMDAFIRKKVAVDEAYRGFFVEQALFKKYRSSLIDLVTASFRPLVYLESPVHFGLKENDLTLLLNTLASENIYNTLRLDAKERATKEVVATVLPAIRQFRVISHSAEIKNFGVIVAYGTRDFSQEDFSLNWEPEVVALVAQADRCRKLDQAELSEEEFVDTADVYVVDAGPQKGTGLAVRKIKVSLSNK
jgi:hypothetical protein